jgi:signal transduction histidine kinase
MNAAPEIAENAVNDEIANFPTTYFHFSDFTGGSLLTVSYQPPSNEIKSLQQRAAKVFDLAFRRFLDLKKAESQAREAQIEAALEKVRSRSMAMHKSEELKEVIQLVYDQMLHLKMPVEHTGFIIDYKQRDDMHIWLADMNSTPVEVSFPYFDAPHWNSYIEAKKTGASFFANHHSFEEKNAFYTKLFDLLPGVLDDVRNFYFNCPGLDISTVLLDNIGLYIENFSGNPYTDEENAILMRFGKVFQQAYTRFIDLQKAEASAREAQIEAALERIRSRSMAMHKSEELADLSMEVVKQIQALGVPTWFCAFNIHDDDPRGSLEWGSNAEATFPKYRTPREGIFLRYYEAWQRGEKLLVNEIGEDECSAHYEYLCSLPGVGEQLLKMKNAGIPFPTYQIDHVAYFKYGYILFITYQPVPETHEIFKRFAKVFEQSYTRFLDLQKAEAQAREAQIEAALERVRSRSLAMHHTNELQDVVNVAAQQLLRMDIDFDGGMFITVNDEVKDDLPFWAAAGAADYVQKVTLPFLDRPTFTVLHNAILRREPFHTEYYSASEKNEFLEHMFRYDPWKQNSEERKQELLARQGGYTRSVVIGKYTSIGITNHHGKIFSDAENDVLRRFGAVLEQSYTRFLDLQKAEEQAREAQIQLALERARSQSMTMQRSVELDDTLRVFHEQVLHLGISSEFSFLWLPDEEKDRHIFWATWAEKKLNVFNSKAINYPLDRTEPATALCLADWKGSEPVVSYRVTAEGVTDYFAAWSELIAGVEELKPENFKEGLYYVEAFIRYGCFGVMVRNELKEDEKEILRRFAVEFESTYTRFLDLRKAEAQAREARIEAALEKVRSRTMAMQKSSELPDAANVLFLQVQSLGIPAWSCGYNILAPDKRSCTCIMSSEGEIQIPFVLPLTEHWSFLPWYEAIQTGFEFFTNEQGGEDLVEHYRYMGTVPGLEDVFKQFDDAGISLPTHQINHLVSFTNGFLLFITYEPVPEAHDIFKRFAKVFEQTYTRFLDLQKAEEQTREAQIEAALEKVRSRTLAMQRSDELGEVASILFKQMNQLVHNLWTCGFVLCEKDRTEDEWWLSMDGDFTRGFFLPNVGDYAHATLYEGWLKGETARSVQLDGEALQQHYDWLMEIPVARKIFEEMDAAGLARPDWQKLHAAYFSKGYLVLITREPCAEEEIFKRFAAVFNLAYTRFKDLQISEAHALQAEKDLIAIKEAKQKAEVALTELQATQKQLIQAEKMASLGELTAGIAHEIQNPLNFVNNFSSLNTELVAELKEAISSGNWADAEEIIGMLSENEEKILQHGKRADAIVKGMLQHTRSGSGTKEPTDINALCDEYLRLAFHGFRAKDKSFNSDFNFTADPDLGKINAVPQEIGRVILNLISNAFYAVHEKAKSSGKDYQPAVKVMTRKSDGMVVIAVADNGTGIPQKVVDKIFQPFFTTKPTGEGTGLGLSLSYDIVKAHGGELKVETKEGEGTAFVISLPANSV